VKVAPGATLWVTTVSRCAGGKCDRFRRRQHCPRGKTSRASASSARVARVDKAPAHRLIRTVVETLAVRPGFDNRNLLSSKFHISTAPHGRPYQEDSQLAGALIVDPRGVSPPDRVFVLGLCVGHVTACTRPIFVGSGDTSRKTYFSYVTWMLVHTMYDRRGTKQIMNRHPEFRSLRNADQWRGETQSQKKKQQDNRSNGSRAVNRLRHAAQPQACICWFASWWISHEERADCAKQITGEVHVATQEPRWNGTAFWNRYTALIGPGYRLTTESMVSSVTPSTVACATKILSKGSL